MAKVITEEMVQARIEKAIEKERKAMKKAIAAELKAIEVPECANERRGCKAALRAVQDILKAA